MTVRTRLLLVTTAAMAITMAVWGWMQFEALDNILLQQQQRRLDELADTIHTYYEHFPTVRGLGALDLTLKDHVQSDTRLARIDVFSLQRGIMVLVAGAGRTSFEWSEENVTSVAESMKPRYFNLETDIGPALGLLSPNIYERDGSIHVVGVVTLSQPRLEVVSRAKLILLASSLILLLIIVALIFFAFENLIGRPLAGIMATIGEFRRGDYSRRMTVERPDELGRLAEHFNAMAAAVEEAMARNRELTLSLQERVQEETLKVAGLQQEVNQLQRLAAMGHLTANLAHDIGTPIHSIKGFARLLLEKEGWPPDVKRKLELIEQQAQRLDAAVRDIKRMTRPPEPHFEVTTVEEILSETLPLVEPQLQKGGVNLKVTVGEGIPPLYLDRSRVQTALLNLIQNSVEALAGKGEIVVQASLSEGGDYAVIRVRDNGPGIPPELMERICEPFFSTRAETGIRGLGLAIVRDIMKVHGGELLIESSPREGTEVKLLFPIRPPQTAPVNEEERSPLAKP
ncbi:MAG TPA: ATP-binding protein [Syntrophales bacterium]|nr:ATP-binding protein [Syntrophales bacterium]HOM06286.1 ATP-binding protein [Syntrophales bacterium]HON99275.1 ATP-binding protein [Syntrophales bacterium]HPC00100.1 ATP-binding protein [Syntrophales bacterium]HPQ05733.1 ATP-binding protein [Syntrophales bacterium]